MRQCEKVYESKKTYGWQKKYANVKNIWECKTVCKRQKAYTCKKNAILKKYANSKKCIVWMYGSTKN